MNIQIFSKQSKIEKVPRGIQGEKSNKDMTMLRGCPWKNQAEGGKGHDSDFDNFLCMRYYWDTCPNCKI